MTLILRDSADHFPKAGWKKDGTDFVVLSGEVLVGSIKHLQGGPAGGSWLWSITCLIPANEGPRRGVGPTREDAMRALAASWREWLDKAGLMEKERA